MPSCNAKFEELKGRSIVGEVGYELQKTQIEQRTVMKRAPADGQIEGSTSAPGTSVRTTC